MHSGFWALPKLITRRTDLSFRSKMVAGVLWTRRNQDNMSYPSRRYIAESIGVSIDTVDRGIKELKDKAGLKVIRKGLRKNNRYILPNWNSESTEMHTLDSANLPVQDSATLQDPIVRENKKDNIVIDDQSSIKDIILFFKKRVLEIKGYTPEINWSKDMKLISIRLKKYSFEQMKELIDWYLYSQHSQRLGDSLSICLSVNIMNLWKANTVSSQFHISRFYPTSKKI